MTIGAIVAMMIGEGVECTVTPDGALKISGDESTVEKWLPEIRANKAALVALLTGGTVADTAGGVDQAGTIIVPPWCAPDCPRLETIPPHGSGCARQLPDGGEEWRALFVLKGCPLVNGSLCTFL